MKWQIWGLLVSSIQSILSEIIPALIHKMSQLYNFCSFTYSSTTSQAGQKNLGTKGCQVLLLINLFTQICSRVDASTWRAVFVHLEGVLCPPTRLRRHNEGSSLAWPSSICEMFLMTDWQPISMWLEKNIWHPFLVRCFCWHQTYIFNIKENSMWIVGTYENFWSISGTLVFWDVSADR